MPTQTPASRRFRLPLSAASAPSQKPVFAASQFIRPSQPSSSPYARTPFSSTAQKQGKDEIVADDSLSEDDDVESRRDELSGQPVRGSASATEEDELVDDLRSPSLMLPTQLTQSILSREIHIPPSKRRKLSHPEIIDDDLDLDLPSPPSSPTHTQTDNQPDKHNPEIHIPRTSPSKPQIEDHDNNNPSSPTSSQPPSPPHNLQTPKLSKSRFRDTQPPPQSSITIPQIFPSFQSRLLASNTVSTSTNPTTRSPNSHLRGPRPNLDLTLPDAFSPSRKRGNREYVYGGLAETVRGWVVDVATRVVGGGSGGIGAGNHRATADTTTNQSVSDEAKPSGTHTVLIDQILRNDNSGRFVLIRSKANQSDIAGTKDGDGEKWMLINTDPQARKIGGSSSRMDSSRLTGVRPGRTVAVKGGGSMTWGLNLDLNTTENAGGEAGAKCKVAVLWELVSGSGG